MSESNESKRDFLKHLRLHEDHAKKIKIALIWIIATAAVTVVIGGIAFGATFGYERLYDHRIFPGVRILGIRMDGLTENEARLALNREIDNALKDGLRFNVQNREVTLNATTITQDDADASNDLIRYNIDQPIVAAMKFGRSGNWIADVMAQWRSRMHPVTMDTEVRMNEQAIASGILHSAEDISPSPKNAELHAVWDEKSGQLKTDITAEKTGTTLNINPALQQLRDQANQLDFSPISISGTQTNPSITAKDLQPFADQVQSWVKHAPITLTYETTKVPIDIQHFASWTSVERNQNGSLQFTIDGDQFHKDIRSLTNIEQPVKNGTLDIQDGKIASFEPGSVGYTIDDDATIKGIVSNLDTTSTMPLVVVKEQGSFAGDDPQTLGIKEIIGVGTSDFSGSPNNRQKNIANGVKHVNGTLIAPGEEFSMLKTLGAITAENGWLPELVIKGNKTTPELGGGLCQIGTTAFRAAMNSGLKITQRQNHSYRVRYYEPAGTDATIYDPAPDFRFLNDTKTYILIHAYIKGTTVIYEFWGTKDGRIADVPTPTVSNIVQPPPTKLVETLDLAPGKKKCTETAHAGADASLHYTVTYADGTTHEQTFNSHYRPWQAVCLIGVEKLSDPAASASSTTPLSAD